MDLALISLEKIVEMFLILVVGILLYKFKIIDSDMNKKLSNFILMFVTPFLLFTSYQMDFTRELLNGWLQTFTLAVISFALIIIMTRILVPKSKKWDTELERICIIYSNCGYIGIPLLNELYGKQGVFYMTVYMTVFNVLVWTQGVTLLTGKSNWRQTLKNLRSPVIIAVVLGVICFFLQIKLPPILENPMESIGAINTPMAMLVAGASLAETNMTALLTKWRVYGISFIKLIVCPILFIFVVGWFTWEELPLMTILIATACPSGTTGTLLALRYGRDNMYATELLAISTIFSILTIPLIILLKGLVFG